MKVTVCQLHNAGRVFAADWDHLTAHVQAERSQLVLLPEMPFYPWFPTAREFDPGVWKAALNAHDVWERRLPELAPALPVATRPIDFGNMRYNAGFIWQEAESLTETVHVKCCVSSQDGAWENVWYTGAVPEFETFTVDHGMAYVGMLIGLELWMPEQARLYGLDGAQLIAIPRADRSPDTDPQGANEWLQGGIAAAKAAAAYCISSSRGTHGTGLGGPAWVISPQGETLAMTSSERPFATVEIDLDSMPRGVRVPSIKTAPLR
jgi:N-carbamoylputrescine amidase